MGEWREKASEITGSYNTANCVFVVESDRDQDFYCDGEGVFFSRDLRTRAYELAYRLNAAGFPSRVREVWFYTALAKNPTFDDKTINPGM